MALNLNFLIHKVEIILSFLLTILEIKWDIGYKNALYKILQYNITILLFSITDECLFGGVYTFICTHLILLKYLCFTTLFFEAERFIVVAILTGICHFISLDLIKAMAT